MAKILVIDDEQGMRQVTAKILMQQGYTLLQAEDGASAMQILQSEKLDLVLLDIRLPDMDGVEILANIRKMRTDLPVIMLSGFGDVETAVELVRQGAYDYVSKPYKIDKLLSMVKNALEQNNVTTSETAPLERKAQPKPPQEKTSSDQKEEKTTGKKIWLFAGAATVVLLAGGLLSYIFLFNGQLPEKEFPIPYSNPLAISFCGGNMWVSDLMEESIYKHAMDDKLSIAAAFKLPGTQINGLACQQGEYIWTCSTFEQKIRKHRMDYNLSVVSAYNAPGLSISGLYFDGINLWSMDFQQGKINKHKIDDLSILNTYKSPAANPCGMFKNGASYYIADGSSNKIYKVKGNDFSLESVYTMDAFKERKYHITGMGFDGKSIWICASGAQIIFRLPLKSLKPAN